MSAGTTAVDEAVAIDSAVEVFDALPEIDVHGAKAVDADLLRVITRVAHREHLHVPAVHTHLAHPHSGPTRFTRRRPAAAPGASALRARGTTARKVIWS